MSISDSDSDYNLLDVEEISVRGSQSDVEESSINQQSDHSDDLSEDWSADDSTYVPSTNSETDDSASDSDESNSISDVRGNGQTANDGLIVCNDWGILTNNPPVFKFHGPAQPALQPRGNTPLGFYELFLTNELLDQMVSATNEYAHQNIQNRSLTRRSRFLLWKPVDRDTMKQFLGLLMYMGIVKYPSISHYWNTSGLYRNNVASNVMKRNYFQLLLRFWHFNPDSTGNSDDRLRKLNYLVKHLNKSFKMYRKMGSECVIDESMVPFRGRLKFKQYIPSKAHKYGVKLYKLCDTKGYIYSFRIYAGKNLNKVISTEDLVMNLMAPYLHRGRLLVTDNFYTSVSLAERLLNNKTYLLGTVKPNRKNLPKIDEKLETGDLIAYENSKKVVYMVWQDKRPVRMLSTKLKLDIERQRMHNRNQNNDANIKCKPTFVIKYNKTKIGVDVSDQLASYQTSVRKSIRWYHKVAEELLFGAAIINARELYNSYNSRVPNFKTMKTLKFRESVISDLLGIDTSTIPYFKRKDVHTLRKFERKDTKNRLQRKQCVHCYSKQRKQKDRKSAKKNVKKVSTFCDECPRKPALCLDCFREVHSK